MLVPGTGAKAPILTDVIAAVRGDLQGVVQFTDDVARTTAREISQSSARLSAGIAEKSATLEEVVRTVKGVDVPPTNTSVLQAEAALTEIRKGSDEYRIVANLWQGHPGYFGDEAARREFASSMNAGRLRMLAARQILSDDPVIHSLLEIEHELTMLQDQIASASSIAQLVRISQLAEGQAGILERQVVQPVTASLRTLGESKWHVEEPVVWRAVGTNSAIHELKLIGRHIPSYDDASLSAAKEYANAFINSAKTHLRNAGRGMPHDQLTVRQNKVPIAFLKQIIGVAPEPVPGMPHASLRHAGLA